MDQNGNQYIDKHAHRGLIASGLTKGNARVAHCCVWLKLYDHSRFWGPGGLRVQFYL